MGKRPNTGAKRQEQAEEREAVLNGFRDNLTGFDIKTPKGAKKFSSVMKVRQKALEKNINGSQRRSEVSYNKLLQLTQATALAERLRLLLQEQRRANGEPVNDNDGTLGTAYGKIGSIVLRNKKGEILDATEAARKLRKHKKDVIDEPWWDHVEAEIGHSIEYNRVFNHGTVTNGNDIAEEWNEQNLSEDDIYLRARKLGPI